MKVEFLASFAKDMNRIRQNNVKLAIEKLISTTEAAEKLNMIPHLKKLSGHKSAYRIKLGDYRVGIFVVSGCVEFARLLHRKDIYREFP